MKKRFYPGLLGVVLFLSICNATLHAQSTGFTYQGSLNNSGLPANGSFDFEFKLFDAPSGGTQQGATVSRNNVTVTDGIFSVVLDFGSAAFPGANRFLEISTRVSGTAGITILAPRQPITSTPYSIRTLSSASADNATNATTANNSLQLGGANASQFVQTNDARLTDARNPLPNSPNYINNSTVQQTSSNFNISGSGTAGGTLTGNIVNATTQINIGGTRVLTSPGSFNLFVGNGAGQLNSTGTSNSFFGVNAGIFNSTGGSNTFAGFEAGRNNNGGSNNSYFGKDAGRSSTTGNDNSFFGNDAGQSNTTGASNSFFGKGSGANNTTATGNSFFGFNAGNSNTTGGNNAFFGFEAGRLSDDAFNNSFFGYEAGESNVIGLNNAFFGFVAGKLNTGSRNSFFGSGAGQVSTGGFHNSFFGGQAGGANTTGDDNTFVGLDSGLTNTTGSFNTAIGSTANVGTSGLTNATAIGANAFVEQSNALVLGSVNGVNGATANTDVGIGTTTPARRLDVSGNVRIGTGTTGCVEDRDGTVIAGVCSSDLRFKKNITPFGSILNSFSKLRPVNYFWRADEFPDQHFGTKQAYGLIAQEVEELFPELVSTDENGYKAVNYSRLPLLTIQAVKEQQVQIEAQAKEIAELKEVNRKLQMQIDVLRRAICKSNPSDEVCKEEK